MLDALSPRWPGIGRGSKIIFTAEARRTQRIIFDLPGDIGKSKVSVPVVPLEGDYRGKMSKKAGALTGPTNTKGRQRGG